MGRRVAGSSFAQGLAISLKPGEQLTIFTGTRETLPKLQALLQPLLRQGSQVQLHADLDPALISETGCLHLPIQGCTIGVGCVQMVPQAASRSQESPIPSAPMQ